MSDPDENHAENGQQHLPRAMGGNERAGHCAETEPANGNGFPSPVPDRAADQACNGKRDRDEESNLVNIVTKENGSGGRHERDKQGAKQTMHEAKPRKTDGDSVEKGIRTRHGSLR